MSKLQRFFVENKLNKGEDLLISDTNLVHQLFHVFRKKKGDHIILLDNSGFEYLAEIFSINKKEIEVKILDEKEVKNIARNKITLFASLIKKDKFEWVLEKCTELGVSKFVPIISERSEKKGLNIERANKILKEASEQSERGRIPEICEPITLKKALKDFNSKAVVLHLEGQQFNEKEFEGDLGIFIGPEGGWGEEDIKIFEENEIPLVCLGSQVLRAETASVAICAKILL